MPKLFPVAAATCAAILLVGVAHGQSPRTLEPPSPASGGSTLWSGVYTNEQAMRGKENYEKFCFRCHKRDLSGNDDAGANTAPALVGERFVLQWADHTAVKIFTKLKTEMPPVYSEAVSDDIKIDILAYILKSNGFPAGSRELTTDRSVLEAIRFVPRNGDAVHREPRDLLPVQSVGCLTSEGSGWTLTRGSDAVLDEEPRSAPPADASSPLGARRYVLIGVNRFTPKSYLGQKVEVRGLITTASADKLIHLTSLKAVAPTCAS